MGQYSCIPLLVYKNIVGGFDEPIAFESFKFQG